MAQKKAHWDDGANNVQKQGPGDRIMDERKAYPVTAATTTAIPAEALLAGLIVRTGPGAGFADTFPSALALQAACPMLGVGDSFEFIIQNGVAFTDTVAVAPGSADQLVGVTQMTSLQVRWYMATLLADGVGGVFSAATTNASNQIVLNGNNPNPAITGLPGGAPIRVGQAVTGTGIPATTYVVAINPTTGTITLSNNATATNAVIGLTFLPRVEYRGIMSGTA